ncbi:ABC transporter ATP-binding protein [Bacillus sp. ISL-40]|uniref:ABC transporter ATP-binding protein n=1 Tax=unclassified Bacillus (in: firmicutes) TaxID=185979 RepID=UPI001BEBAC33|nr:MULTISPECIES: ABC transporter ATP-binding protein [unclassified Bacillus (in: firmicutes)]MBT2696910.1 ABC transporter ATP-binding protein [Bacillus sp. ISL-40]MBT2719804.1 ABC transporter ATP-binding protein [Bacillus sp. ISL-46]MBT2742486.1 ABC transporter ATP-binding protein [Bacillus sp. ISL-77]
MKFLSKYIKKYWKSFSIAVLFLTIEAISDLMQPTIMAKIIDEGVANKDIGYVLKMGGLMLLITACGAIAASTRSVVASIVSQNFGTELRSDLFKKIQTLSFKNIDKFDRASLVTRLTNDVTQVQVFVNGLMRVFVKAPLLAIGGLIMATRLNLQLSVVLAVVVPIVALLIIFNMRLGFPLFSRVQNGLDRVNSVMREYLSGVRVVKAFNRFDVEVGKFTKVNDQYKNQAISANRLMSSFSPAIMLTVNLGIVVVLWIGGNGVNTGGIQVGHIIAFINYMTQILFSLMMISMVFTMFVRAKASAGRIDEVFSQADNVSWNEELRLNSIEKGRIDFENVSFSYEQATGEPILKNINLTILPGETVGIVGSTGSGKSTLVGLIPRFYDTVGGTIKVDGVDSKQVSPKKLREKIAIVPQKNILFTGSVAENIRWGNEEATDAEVVTAATMAGAHDFIERSPEAYQTRIGQGGVNFSGGQKQRISIARALVKKPEILILDDSTSAVDVATEAKIKEALKKYAKGLTCLLIAQRITSIIDADKIVVLDRGEVVGVGTHQGLLKDCRVYQEIYQSQVGKEVHP